MRSAGCDMAMVPSGVQGPGTGTTAGHDLTEARARQAGRLDVGVIGGGPPGSLELGRRRKTLIDRVPIGLWSVTIDPAAPGGMGGGGRTRPAPESGAGRSHSGSRSVRYVTDTRRPRWTRPATPGSLLRAAILCRQE